jgi:hypothetical protein
MVSNYIIEVQHAEHQHWLVLLDKETQGEGPEQPIPHPLLYLRKPIMFETTLALPLSAAQEDEEDGHEEE